MQVPARRHLVAGAAVLTGVAGAVTALVLPSADAEGVRFPEFGPPASVPFRPEFATPLPVEAAVPTPVIPAPGVAAVAAASRYTPVTPSRDGRAQRKTGTGPYPHRNSGWSRTAAGGPTPTVRSNGERAAEKALKRVAGRRRARARKRVAERRGRQGSRLTDESCTS